MPTRLSLYPYKIQSSSAKALARTLGVKRIRQQGKYRWRASHRIINWGNARIASWMSPQSLSTIWNKPVNVSLASDKTETFKKLQLANLPIPDFTTNPTIALEWLISAPKYPGKKHAVLCRTLTRANSGRGIVLASTPVELVPAPLYTRYVPKQAEYRIHVFRELGIIDMQQKRRDSSVAGENRNLYIRNHDAGWVFCRENLNVPEVVKQVSIDAILALDLDFGAVDIGYHEQCGPCIYEINTAPGLEGQTLINYTNAFKQLYV